MHIERVTEMDESIVTAFERLMPQLTNKERNPSYDHLKKVIEQENVHFCIATEDDEIIGTVTIVFITIPSGLKVWIEDVIVDESAGGKGVGTALLWHALQVAREKGAIKVDLTSHPRREAANRLYQKMGFEKRESNVYRYYLTRE